MIRMKYHKYPNLIRAMANRPQRYREELAYCKQLEQSGNAIVLRPSVPIAIGRCEKNAEQLLSIYALGVRDARAQCQQVKDFMQRCAKEESSC